MPPRQNKSKLIGEFAPNLEQSLPASDSVMQLVKSWAVINKKKLIIASGVLLCLLVVGFTIKTQLDLRNTKDELAKAQGGASPEAIAESKKIVEAVGKLVILPKGEEPTVATVTDPAKLADQPFFDNSQTGDKVLIYTTSQRAILYRPSENKVIEIAPLNINGGSAGDVAGRTTELESAPNE